jgi:hypothetical protein
MKLLARTHLKSCNSYVNVLTHAHTHTHTHGDKHIHTNKNTHIHTYTGARTCKRLLRLSIMSCKLCIALDTMAFNALKMARSQYA